MNKKYESPELTVAEFDKDIITTSSSADVIETDEVLFPPGAF